MIPFNHDDKCTGSGQAVIHVPSQLIMLEWTLRSMTYRYQRLIDNRYTDREYLCDC